MKLSRLLSDLRAVSLIWGCGVQPPVEASPQAPPPTPYEFLGRLQRIGMLSELQGQAAVADLDPRWFAEFVPKEIIQGSPPRGEAGVVCYAIHSPSLLGLTGNVGKIYRVRGELQGTEANRRHRIELERQAR